MAGCSSSTGSFDPGAEPAGLGEQVTRGKADGAFGSTEISIGDTVTGETAGDGIVLYALELETNDQLEVRITRTSGDLEPAAYFYRGTETFVRPDHFDVSPSNVVLDFTIATGGQHHIVVKAHHGAGAGGFELEVTCTGGPCDGGSMLTGVRRQSECIQDAARCAVAALPAYDGRVGAVTAQRVFDGCLADQGSDCEHACDGSEDLDSIIVCETIVDRLPALADQPVACHDTLNACLDGCEEIGGFYGFEHISESAAANCWDGYNGNCLEYIDAHASCGGDLDEGSVGECYAYCSATEGAWDEGPWDGCTDHCRDLQSAIDGFIEDVADSVGEFFDETDHEALTAISTTDVPENVMRSVQRFIDDYDEAVARDPEREARGDHAELADVAPMSIRKDDELVGYQLSVDYYIDAPLFDGAGERLFLNLEGDIVAQTGWTG